MLPSIFNENVFDDLFDQTMNMDTRTEGAYFVFGLSF